MTFEEAALKLEEVDKPLPDPLLEKARTYELSDAEWNYIKANPTLSRSEISKNLGIERTVLLVAIDKRKKTSK